jgi:hypothetical protein
LGIEWKPLKHRLFTGKDCGLRRPGITAATAACCPTILSPACVFNEKDDDFI